jgi:linoleoyl-CoA desaturase
LSRTSTHRITYPKEPDAFYNTLKQRVYKHLEEKGKSRFANRHFYIKALVLFFFYVLCYSLTLTLQDSNLALLFYVLMGPLAILMGLNIAHDAAHGVASANPRINKLLLLTFDILGANSYMWRNRHIHSHHSYPNILHQDADLKQNAAVRIFPHDKLRKAHRFQHFYTPFLYLVYTLNWLLHRDFADFTKKQIGSFKNKRTPKAEIFKLVFFKLVYFSYILLLPLMFSNLSVGQVITGYLVMNALAGITITLALVPAHVASTSHFPLPNEDGVMPHSWSRHQMLTTTDYATDNLVINWMMGGFNHHIVHHLFPNISQVHYKELTAILKETAKEFNIPYNYEKSIINAYLSHFKLLKNNGLGKHTQSVTA